MSYMGNGHSRILRSQPTVSTLECVEIKHTSSCIPLSHAYNICSHRCYLCSWFKNNPVVSVRLDYFPYPCKLTSLVNCHGSKKQESRLETVPISISHASREPTTCSSRSWTSFSPSWPVLPPGDQTNGSTTSDATSVSTRRTNSRGTSATATSPSCSATSTRLLSQV